MSNNSKTIALVLGGHINGYSIVKELYEEGVSNIAVFHYGRSLAGFSNKVDYVGTIDKTKKSLLENIEKLSKSFDSIIIFPTDDMQLENLNAIHNEIKAYCYLPFNHLNILETLDKSNQYAICEESGVPYPKTLYAKIKSDLQNIDALTFPLLIKPSVRKDLTTKVFRTLYLTSFEQYEAKKIELADFIDSGVEFLISEYIPGDDTNIYAYTCFRSQDGNILNEWVGKKLTQYPDNYGVVCSASNENHPTVVKQGRLIVNSLNAYGIVEPEFKFDSRDGKFKLMETNLRSMMWNRVGCISGVKLHKSLYLYANKKKNIKYSQVTKERIHFVLMLHEIPNLIARRGYWKYFKHNVFGGDERVWAVFESSDIKPFLYSLYLLTKLGVSACLRRLGLR